MLVLFPVAQTTSQILLCLELLLTGQQQLLQLCYCPLRQPPQHGQLLCAIMLVLLPATATLY